MHQENINPHPNDASRITEPKKTQLEIPIYLSNIFLVVGSDKISDADASLGSGLPGPGPGESPAVMEPGRKHLDKW
jgi:hypothetical protein